MTVNYSRIYEEYIRSEAWGAVRQQRLTQDNFTCQRCGTRANLHVHHRTYKRLTREYLSDLVTLCETCHDLIHAAHHKQKRKSLEKITDSMLPKQVVAPPRPSPPPRLYPARSGPSSEEVQAYLAELQKRPKGRRKSTPQGMAAALSKYRGWMRDLDPTWNSRARKRDQSASERRRNGL